MNISLRPAIISDVQIISVLGLTTCYEAYFEIDPSADLAEYCVNFFNLEQITAELNDPNSTFLILEVNDKAVGYAKLREGKKIECLKGKNAIEVQRIYLLEKVKGKNLGKMLMDKCLAVGKAKGYEMLWLGVWDKNIAAQQFYQKIGMTNIGTTDFSDGKNQFLNLVYATEIS